MTAKLLTALLFMSLLGVMTESSGEEKVFPSLEKLDWLAGCWGEESSARKTEEQWMTPLGNSMMGMSRTVADGKTVEFEYLRIEERDGRLVYTALPSGQKETTFTQTEIDEDSVLFVNEKHDFPQRIRYTHQLDGALLAQIEGQNQVIQFPMKRVACINDKVD